MTYEKLLQEAAINNIYVMEKVSFESRSKGLINNDVIGLSDRLENNAERACVLAEELGHYYTAVGDIIDQTNTINRKQELQGRIFAYDRMIGLMGIIDSYKSGCQNTYEMAEHLGVSEEFLAEALERYRSKYGVYTTVNNYIVYFEPHIMVLEIQN